MVTCTCDYVNGQVRESCVQVVSTPDDFQEEYVDEPTDTGFIPDVGVEGLSVGAEGASVAQVSVPAASPSTVTSVRNPTVPAALFPTPMYGGNGFGATAGGARVPVTGGTVGGGTVGGAVASGGMSGTVSSSGVGGKASGKGKGSGKGSGKGDSRRKR